jgi:hypothetical protein
MKLWARDAAAGSHEWIRSAQSLSTVTMLATAVWTDADPIAGAILAIASSGVTAETATVTVTSIEPREVDATVIVIVTSIGAGEGNPFLTPSTCIRIMSFRYLADVAELADAQVSEACDGDIVEVQVLSSAPDKD